MRSGPHLIISLSIGALLSAFLDSNISIFTLVAYAGVVGIAIDFDHFLIARWNSGSWEALLRCMRDPKIVFIDQDAIFQQREDLASQRLLTHHILGAILTVSTWIIEPTLGLITGVVLYGHILADIVYDIRQSGSNSSFASGER